MENLLQTIVKNRKAEEISKLNAVQIVTGLFSELMDRERDVLSRRFALNGGDQQTLEEIGKIHNLTRERVRQIESASIKKIKKLENLEEYLQSIKAVVGKLLEEHGGLMERDFLLNILTVFCFENSELSESDQAMHKKNFDFIISQLLQDEIERTASSENFNVSYRLKEKELGHFEEIVKELSARINSLKKTLTTEEILDLTKEMNAYGKHEGKFSQPSQVDLTSIFKNPVFPEWADVMNANKVLYSLLQAAKNINQNRFGHWGLNEWPEIKPKKISDKIYLILKNNAQPMHFTDITEKINSTGFDDKRANTGTVHNELILDSRYALFDRGVYGLKEWKNAPAKA